MADSSVPGNSCRRVLDILVHTDPYTVKNM